MKKPEKFIAIVSARAGGYRKGIRYTVADAFAKSNKAVDFVYIEHSARELKRVVENFYDAGGSSFLAIGGDGTVSMVASLLYGRPHRLGIIPAGTANTMARLLNIPLAPSAAAKVAATSTATKAIDGIVVEKRLYLMNVSAGVSSRALDTIDQDDKSWLGIISYLLGGARVAVKLEAENFILKIDDSQIKIKTPEVHITNTGVLGLPQYRLCEGASLDDGLLEVITIKQQSSWGILNALLDTLRRRKQSIQLVGRGKDIILSSQKPVPVQGDGDIIGKTPVSVHVSPRAVNIIVPEPH